MFLTQTRCYPLDGMVLCSKCHVKKLHKVVFGKKQVVFKKWFKYLEKINPIIIFFQTNYVNDISRFNVCIVLLNKNVIKIVQMVMCPKSIISWPNSIIRLVCIIAAMTLIYIELINYQLHFKIKMLATEIMFYFVSLYLHTESKLDQTLFN